MANGGIWIKTNANRMLKVNFGQNSYHERDYRRCFTILDNYFQKDHKRFQYLAVIVMLTKSLQAVPISKAFSKVEIVECLLLYILQVDACDFESTLCLIS